MKTKKEYLLFAAIILLAAFLRFYNLSYTEFKADQALNLYLGLDLINNHFIANQVLLSSVATYNSPLFHYLIALPLILSKNPIFTSGFIAFFNILAVLMTYLLVKKIANPTAARLAALFYAVNPWAILYSRHIWHQNILPFFVLIFIYGLVSLVKNKNGNYLILAVFGLAFALQLHLSSLPLILLLGIVMFWQRKNIKFIHLLLTCLILLLIFMPYFIFEITHNYYNLKQYLKLSQLPWQFNLDAALIPWQLSTTLGFENYLGGDLPAALIHPPLLLILDILSLILFLISFFWTISKIKIKKEYLILCLWFLLLVLFLLFNKTSLYNHYFLILFPAQFIFLALFINNKFDRIYKTNKTCKNVFCAFMFSALSVIIVYQCFYSFAFLNIIKQKQCFSAEYGPTLRYQMAAVQKTLKDGKTDLTEIFQASCQCSPYCHPYAIGYLVDYYKN